MNDGRQMGVHYMDGGFPYAVNENFGDFFQGLAHVPVNYAFAGSMPDQQVALEHGLILVDTKYEFGKANDGSIMLIDEVHTPDSSRYWIANSYLEHFQNGLEPENVDKEFLRLWFKSHCNPYEDEVTCGGSAV